MTDEPYCQRCKSTENLSVNSTTVSKKGIVKHSYMCRDCNTERARKYRATTNGRQRINEAVWRSTQKHMNKHLARLKVSYALKRKAMIRPDKCSSCHEIKKVEAHHDDYSKPLEVKWFCRTCHADYHRAHPEIV